MKADLRHSDSRSIFRRAGRSSHKRTITHGSQLRKPLVAEILCIVSLNPDRATFSQLSASGWQPRAAEICWSKVVGKCCL
jgi:hypothetical protein